jgi:hypothetical protein
VFFFFHCFENFYVLISLLFALSPFHGFEQVGVMQGHGSNRIFRVENHIYLEPELKQRS